MNEVINKETMSTKATVKLLGQIAEGLRNKIIPPKDLKGIIDTVSKYRTQICESCEHHSKYHDTPLRPDDHCTDCTCNVSIKTKCLSCRCPLDIPKWVEVHTLNNN